MESENRNKAKWYVLTYSDGKTPAAVVHGWPAVLDARHRSKAKVTAKGFHTEEVAQRYLNKHFVGSVTFQRKEKPQIVGIKIESI